MRASHRIFRQIFAISTVTFQEIIREKVLWSSFVFALFCICLAYAVSQLSFTENSRVAMDFGLTSISIIGGLISVIMGASLIAKEVQNRTLYLVLTKAIWRWQFVVGRFVGLLGVLAINSVFMMIIVLIVVRVTGGQYSAAPLLKCFALQLAEFGVLAAMATIFSSLSTATLAAIFASGVWVIGHAMTDLRLLSQKIEPVFMRPVIGTLAACLPDLTRFDVKSQVSHELPITWAYTGVSVSYAAAYVLFALVAACMIFSRRDL